MPERKSQTTVRRLAAIATVIVCTGGSIAFSQPWPSDDPCPYLEMSAKYFARCGFNSTSGRPIVNGDEPCEKVQEHNNGQ